MKVGFIGAGKVGFSLGKYLSEKGISVTGYYSRNPQSAEEAAYFTGSAFYKDLAHLVDSSDTIFVTVPDRAISEVWNDIRYLPIKNKNICHCSGSISSAVFLYAENYGAYCYSIHPLCAVSDKFTSYKELAKTCFTIEGSPQHLQEMQNVFSSLGNTVVKIDSDKKILYHAAAVMVSNQIVALAEIGTKLLLQCGFEREEAEKALGPLIEGNAKKIAEVGAIKALTGPIERNDIITVHNHLQVLDRDIRDIYAALSKQLVDIAQKKHPDRNYDEIKKELEH